MKWLIFSLIISVTSVAFSNEAQQPLIKTRFDGKTENSGKIASKEKLTNSPWIKVKFERDLVAGERWLAGWIESSESKAIKVRIRLTDVRDDATLATVEASGTGRSRIWVNLRDLQTDVSAVRVELLSQGKVIAVDEAVLRRPEFPTLAIGTKIPIQIDVAKEFQPVNTPLTFGVAFPAGQLWSTKGIRVVDDQGKSVPAQLESVATWFPQGSIKWLRVDLSASVQNKLFIEYKPEVPDTAPDETLRIKATGETSAEIYTGNVRYTVSTELSPIKEVARDGKLIARAEGSRGLYVIDQNGRVASASSKGATLQIESSGPLSACVRLEGPYRTNDGEELARHITRVEFFAGETRAKVTHTLILTKSTNKVWFREVGWDFALNVGDSPQAYFANSATDWKKYCTFELEPGTDAFMVQDRHFQYLNGENHFEIAKVKGSKIEKVEEGKECGDWAALVGNEQGFLVGCRNAAKMHPKEFSMSGNRISLLLFSPRGGEQLDFTLSSRAKTMDLEGLLAKAGYKSQEIDQAAKNFLKNPNDALGWSKTHELVVDPVMAKNQKPGEFAAAAGELSFPAYAMADPAWLCDSGALGVLHPYDPVRFPEVEKSVEDYVEVMKTFGDRFGEFGILDYQAGPRFLKSPKDNMPALRRWLYSYNFKHDLWYLYARRGQRSLREFAQGSCRFHYDSYMLHASDGKEKIAGFWGSVPGSDGEEAFADPFNLPVHWANVSIPEASTTSDLDKFLLDYYLTGYRRGKDAALSYGEAAKVWFTPGKEKAIGRGLRFLYNVLQSYSVSWDEELEGIAQTIIDYIIDEEGAVGLTTDKAYSTSYKTNSDFNTIWYAYSLLREERLKSLAFSVAEIWRYNYGESTFRRDQTVDISAFLYEHGETSEAETLAIKLRQFPTESPRYSAPFSPFVMRGFATAQKIVVDAGAWKKPVASFSGVEVLDCQPIWFFQHRKETADILRYYSPTFEGKNEVDANVTLAPVNRDGDFGYDTLSVTMSAKGRGLFRIPKDAQNGIYKIAAGQFGTHFLLASSRLPLVTFLNGFWRPIPAQNPAYPIYFKVVSGDVNPELFLEKDSILTAPGDKPFQEGKAVRGWVKLSGEPGIWKIEPKQSGVIGGRGFSPLYAFGDPSLFLSIPPGELPPVSSTDFQQKLEFPGIIHLGGKERMELPLTPEMTGEKIMEQGTIEFYFRPKINPTDISDPTVTLINLTAREGNPLALNYFGGSNPAFAYRLSLTIPVQRQRAIPFRNDRPFFFQKDRWYHIALTWSADGKDKKGEEAFQARIFIDGEQGLNRPYATPAGYFSKLIPTAMVISAPFPCEIAAIRMSTIERYKENFKIPSPNELGTPDKDTMVYSTFKDGKREFHVGATEVKAEN